MAAETTTRNAFVENGTVQIMPNYPPYASKVVEAKGGIIYSAGELAHAFEYAKFPRVEEIHACEIDRDVFDFYSDLGDSLMENASTKYIEGNEGLDELFPDGTMNDRLLSSGPSSYMTFLLNEAECEKLGDRALISRKGKISDSTMEDVYGTYLTGF